jgi:hypothetical protein
MAVTQGAVNKSYVSAIDFLDQRDIDPTIYDQSRDRAFTDIMKVVNRTKPATMFNYHNFVNNDVWEKGTISAVTSTGLAQIQFTINTASTFPRKGDLIKTSNTNNAGRQGLVTTVTFGSGTATLTVRSVGGNSEPLFATIGDEISFGSNAQPEKSTAPTNRRYGLTKYYNLIQIFREVDDITDVQKVAKIEVNVGGDYHILPYQTLMKAVKMKGDISIQMLMGTQSSTSFGDTNPFLSDSTSGLPIQTTGGLDWYIRTYGISDTAAVLGTFGFTELDEIIDNFIANKAPKEYMVFMASTSYRKISKFLKGLGSADVESRKLSVDGKTFDWEVEELKYGGYTFDFVYLPIFDHPQLVGDILPEISGSLYFVPKDQVDTVDNGNQPRMQIRYTPTPFTGSVTNTTADGMVREWRTGALAEVPTSSEMVLHTDWETAQGLECIAVKHFQKYRIV